MLKYRRGLALIVLLAGALAGAGATAAASTHRRPPTRRALPRILGSARVGHVLIATRGRWTGASRFSFRWERCNPRGARCALIAGPAGRGPTHRLTGRDAGHRLRVIVVARNAGGVTSATSRPSALVQQAAAPITGLHASGNRILDGSGHVVHLHGVNRSGTEYACIQGDGIFDGPSDAASVAAIRSWNVNIVRVPLNEDCWLGINGAPPAYSGQNYVGAILRYVRLLHEYGMYAELSLMWGAPGGNQATYQPGSPDADHSPAMWASMARAFRGDPNVILAPWGETVVNAGCFLHGGTCEATYGNDNAPYATAGMQQAVNVMRQNGYQGIISIPGLDFANDMSQWLSHKPFDPRGQLIAEMHIYGGNTCDTTSCLDATVAPILRAGHPVIFGETGETYDDSSCGSSHISSFLNWADQHGVGYEAWTWDTWGTCGSLISDYGGTPANAYGAYVKQHFAGLG